MARRIYFASTAMTMYNEGRILKKENRKMEKVKGVGKALKILCIYMAFSFIQHWSLKNMGAFFSDFVYKQCILGFQRGN